MACSAFSSFVVRIAKSVARNVGVARPFTLSDIDAMSASPSAAARSASPPRTVFSGAPDVAPHARNCASNAARHAAAWRAAFEAQLRAWGATSGAPEKTVRGGDALLAAADGEALIASMSLNVKGRATPTFRATLFAMRTTKDEKALQAIVGDLVAGGLHLRYEGDPHEEEIAGRRVAALPGNQGTLYVLMQNGLLVAADHPLAMGLFLRGLKAPTEVAVGAPKGGKLKLVVRRGRGDAAWEG